MVHLMPTTEGHVLWISETNGANLSKFIKKVLIAMGD